MTRMISIDAMNQGTHIDVTPTPAEGGEYHPLTIVCDCGDTIGGVSSAATVAAWMGHIEQDDDAGLSDVQDWDS